MSTFSVSSLHAWLTSSDAITPKLKTLAHDARLELLTHCWENPDAWDQENLNLYIGKVLHREILMWAFDACCWYARTIIPESSYEVDPSWFKRIEIETLTTLIFDEPKIKRFASRISETTSNDLAIQFLTSILPIKHKRFPTRLTLYVYQEKAPFYLLEIFLPDLMRFV